MRPLFASHEKHGYALVAALLALSAFLALSPTGLVAFSYGNDLVDVAFSSEDVRAFAASNPDFKTAVEELAPARLAALQQAYPHVYSNLPGVRVYQMILDAGDKAMIILLNEDAVFKALEVQL